MAEELVGRAAATDHLAKLLRAAASGVGAFVTVRGPMSAGKTALLRELAVRADSAGAAVLRASGDPSEQGWAFGVTDQLRPVPPGFTVVVVDELQWADGPSVRWLAGIAARALVVAAVRDGEPGGELALPGTVVRLPPMPSARWPEHRVAGCLRRQPEPVRAFAKAMAVLGDGAETDLVTELAGLDAVTAGAAVRGLRALGLVAPQGNPRFAAPAVRDAVLAAMTTSEHDTGHAAAAALLFDRDHPAETVAAHLVATGSDLPEWAAGVLGTTAAPEHLRRAVMSDEGRAGLLVELAVAESTTGGLPALQHLSSALQLHESSRDRAAAVLRLPVTALGEALPLVRDIIADVGQGACTDDRDLALRIEARARYAGHTDLTELTDAATRLRELGPEPDTTRVAERELLTVLVHSAALAARTPAAEVAALAGRLFDPAGGELAQLLVKTLCAADLPVAADDRTSRALAAVHLGDVAEARLLATTVLGERAPVGPEALLTLAVVALRVQDAEVSERLLSSSPREVRNPGLAAVLDLVRGTSEVAGGDAWGGLRRLTDAGGELDRLGWRNVVLFPWRTMAARLHQQLGDSGTARVLAEEDHEHAVAWGAPAGVGRALRVLGGLTEGAEGVDLLHAAADVLSSSADRLELARTHLALGLRLRDRYEQTAAGHLRWCHDIAAGCGEQRLVRQAAALLRGEVTSAELTRAERRVVALAAAGRSNQEVAQALAVSTRAVEKHLTNSYRKLGVLRRAELAGALHHPF